MRRTGRHGAPGRSSCAGLSVLAAAHVPYVQLEPGPTFNTLGKDDTGKDIIEFDRRDHHRSAGQLRFVTIGVRRS